MRPISALMCVYNDNVFTKACLEGIEPCVDQIVIVEGSWDGPRGTYDYHENKSSDDGTRRIVEQFAALHPDKVVLVDSIGDEECSRNLGLNLCEHDWILHLDSDEFYWPLELATLRESILEEAEKHGYDYLSVSEMTFYLNFKWFMKGDRVRFFNTGNGVRYTSDNGVGDILKGGNEKKTSLPVTMAHFQWIGDRYKVLASNNVDREMAIQVEQGEDPKKVLPLGGWRWWLQEIYTQFDGTNLEELVKKNRGSIHPWSFRYKEHRVGKLNKIEDWSQFPEHVRNAPWFNFKEEGLVELHADLA